MIKVFGLPKLVWSIIFLCVQVINFGFLVGSMDYDYWFHQTWDYPDGFLIAPFKFKGSLLNTNRDLGDICDSGDSYKYCYEECNSHCDRFETWRNAGGAYVAFDTLGSILTVIISIILVLDGIKFKYLKKFMNVYTTGFLMIVVTFFHFLAFVIWAGTVKLKFDHCSHQIDYSDTKSVCGEGGASFAIFIFIWLFLSTPVYLFLARKVRMEELNEESNPPAQEPLAYN